MRTASVRSLNPLRLFSSRPSSYEKLPDHGTPNGSTNAFTARRGRFSFAAGATQRFRSSKLSLRLVLGAITLIGFVIFLGTSLLRGDDENVMLEDETSAEEHANTRYWEVFPR